MKRSIELYAEGYEAQNKIEDFMEIPAEDLVRIVNIHKILPQNHARALDFGCGDGRHVEYLNKRGFNVTGTDVSQSAIKATKLRMSLTGNAKVSLDLMEPDQMLSYDDASFELVISWETIHWVGSKELFLQYMKEFKRVLGKNGKIIVTMPTEFHYLKDYSIEEGDCVYHCRAEERDNTTFYSPNLTTLKYLFEDVLGLKIIDIFRYDHGRSSGGSLQSITIRNLFSMYAFLLEDGS